jgi:hypothetical protein
METLLTSLIQEHDRTTLYDGSVSLAHWMKLWNERIRTVDHHASCMMIVQMAKLISFDCGLYKAANGPHATTSSQSINVSLSSSSSSSSSPSSSSTALAAASGSAATSFAVSSVDLVLRLSSSRSFGNDDFKFMPDRDSGTSLMPTNTTPW